MAALAKTDGPIISQLAADAIEGTTLHDSQILLAADAAMKFPGRTSRELAVIEPSLDRYGFARRLPEAAGRGWVEEGPARKCIISRRLAKTWGPVGFFQE